MRKLARALKVDVRDLYEDPALAGKAEAPQDTGLSSPEPVEREVEPDEAPRRTGQQARMMEEAYNSVLLREPGAYGKLLWIIHGVYDHTIPTEWAEVYVAELFVSQEEAMNWIRERILSGRLSLEAVSEDGSVSPFSVEDLYELEYGLASHLYATLRPLEDARHGGKKFVVTLRTEDTD